MKLFSSIRNSVSSLLILLQISLFSSALIGSQHLFGAVSSAQAREGIEKPLNVCNVKDRIIELMKEHVTSKEITEDILIRAHKHFLEDMDPEKLYLTGSEVDIFLDPTRGKEYLQEWNQDQFHSFVNMVEVMKRAIRRSRQYREGFEKKLGGLEDPVDAKRVVEEAVNRKYNRQIWPHSESDLERRLETVISQYIYDQIISSESTITSQALFSCIQKGCGAAENAFQEAEKGWLSLELPSINSKHKQVDDDPFAQKIMKAFVSSFDAHSTVFNDEEAKQLKERLSKRAYGTGIDYSISQSDELIVSRLSPQSPADRAKEIYPGDMIISVNGIPAEALIRSPEKLQRILGDANVPDTVTLVVSPKEQFQGKSVFGDEVRKKVVIRKDYFTSDKDRLDIEKFETDKGYVYALTLHAFYASEDESVSSEKDIKDALEIIKKDTQGKNKPLLGIILDLRDNRGGFLLQAVKVSGLFIRSGVIVVAKYANGEEKAFRDLDPKVLYEGPFIVLTSKITASAAEIVAQSLKDYGVALIVGDERTYGKGSIQMQTVTDEKEGGSPESKSYYKVTIGEYYSVAGESPQLQGVKANIVVPGFWSKQKIGEEYLESALPNPGPIHERFDDTLSDIPSKEKGWMRHYYIPFLQKPKVEWDKYVPELQLRSSQRMSSNPIWRAFILGDYQGVLKAPHDRRGTMKEEVEEVVNKAQLLEAVHIIQDLHELSKEPAVLH